MDFTAEPELQSPLSCSVTFGEQELSSDKSSSQGVFPITETFRLALVVVNDLVFAKRGKYLSETEMLVIKGALND